MNFTAHGIPTLFIIVATWLLATGATTAVARGDVPSTCHHKKVTVKGTDGNDVLKPGDVRSGDVIALGDGSDYIYLGGDDRVMVCGGPGQDALVAGPDAGRHLVLDGEEDRDDVGSAFFNVGGERVAKYAMKLYGGDAYDSITGSLGDDEIRAGNGGDLVNANDGDDYIFGAGAGDELAGEGGADRIFGGGGDDDLSGGRYLSDKTDRGDFTDGGSGRDYCTGRKERSCETSHANV